MEKYKKKQHWEINREIKIVIQYKSLKDIRKEFIMGKII